MCTVTELLEERDASAIGAVVVRLGGSRFAADLDAVSEVGRVPVVTRVPGAPAWLAGIANWRGRLLPVLDLRSTLGGEPTPLGRHARLLVLTADGMSAGLVADAVEGTVQLDADVDELPVALAAAGSDLLSGQVPHVDGPIAVIDVAAVLRLRDQLPRGRR
jgi:purine-binding chemotaxis protein CheW